jgi:ArsR family transcriptional regulator, cadmium/lead-responsive transcriptional repressor
MVARVQVRTVTKPTGSSPCNGSTAVAGRSWSAVLDLERAEADGEQRRAGLRAVLRFLAESEARFTELRCSALDGTDHNSDAEQATMIRRYRSVIFTANGVPGRTDPRAMSLAVVRSRGGWLNHQGRRPACTDGGNADTAGCRHHRSVAIPTARDNADLAAKLFRGLADPTRLEILLALQTGEHRVVDLVGDLGTSQANVSGHLACLKDCGLMTDRAHGRANYYRLARPELAALLGSAETLLAAIGHNVDLCTNYESPARTGRPRKRSA